MARRLWLAVVLCGVCAALVLWRMPAERTLGSVIKIVYLHGALSRAAMLGILTSGISGLVFLLTKRPVWAAWSESLMLSALCFWGAHFLVSMPATRLTWGQWIAWGEPRVTMTLQVLVGGIAVLVITRLLRSASFSSASNLLFAAAVVIMSASAGALRHPLDPIGSSPSPTLRILYLLLILPITGAELMLAYQLASGGRVQQPNDPDARLPIARMESKP